MSIPSSLNSASTTGNSAGINFSGVASGIDTQSIIQKLIQIQEIPLQQLTQQQTQLQSQQQTYQTFGTYLGAVGTAATALKSSTAFTPVVANSSNAAVATLTNTTNASPGTYNVTVSQLAQAEKISSAAQQSATASLNQTGSFVINGATVNVVSTDSLTTIAQKINGLNGPATASIINGGTNNAYLTITSSNTGVANAVQLADTTGSVLGNLGVITGTASIRQSVTNGALSATFNSETASLQSILGNTNLGSSTIQINGTNVTINGTDSLQTIASNINAANAGVTASISTTTNSDGSSGYQLSIVGTSGSPTFTDSNNVLQSMGVLQQGYGNVLIQAKDSNYSIDGVSLTNSSNSISGVIPGATLNLLQGTSASPGTTTLTLSQDISTEQSEINGLVTAYNNMVDYVSQNSQFNSSTFTGGPLFGDPVAEQAMSTTTAALFASVPGLTGQYSNLSGLGFTIDQSGHLVGDATTLTTALTNAPNQVAALFQSIGTGSSSNISYISSTSKTVPSGTGQYAVNISQLATQGSYTGETAQTQASTSAETLTFNGALFYSTPYTLSLPSGNTAAQTVAAINNDSTLQNDVIASLDSNGNLLIQSKRYGTSGNFTVYSDQQATSSNSGIGVGMLGTGVTGLDVAGTINGEPATGAGQFLTGNSGNSTTDGLQIQYTGTATGAVGNLTFTKGLASTINDLMTSFTDPNNGLLASTNQSLQNQIDSLTTDMTSLSAEISANQLALQQKFANMETLIAQMQMQGGQLAALSGSSSSSSSSSSTTPTINTGTSSTSSTSG